MPGGQTPPHSVLPPVEIGTAQHQLIDFCTGGFGLLYRTQHPVFHYLTLIMNVATVYVGFIVMLCITAQVSTHYLNKATAQQCRTHDWPIAAHKVHMDWCADNGYATK